MPKGQLTPETQLARALAKASEFLGVELEVPIETTSDKLAQAEAAQYYFYSRGEGWEEKECKFCNRVFSYCWDRKSISYCSIQCAQGALKQIGLDWDPAKDPSERWGKTIPAVVPPDALELLKEAIGDLELKEEMDATQEDQIDSTPVELSQQ